MTGLRDVVTMVVGAVAIISQVQIAKDHPESVNFWLLAVGTGLLTAPGAIGIWMIRRGSGETPDTPEPPSQRRQRAPSRR